MRARALRIAGGALTTLLSLALTSCTSSSASPAGEPVTVYAAASLRETFERMAQEFAGQEPDTTIQFVFAGSTDLVAQLVEGARADVVATADEITMQRAADEGVVTGSIVPFANNALTIVTAPENPHAVASFRDLAQDDLVVVVCAPQVPCGRSLSRIADDAGVHLDPASEEHSVTDVLGKVLSGQADAGIVYRTDARLAGDRVHEVAFVEAKLHHQVYPLALTPRGMERLEAQRFVDFARSAAGRAILDAAGFGVVP